MENPFNPQFGQKPETFFGRNDVINQVLAASKDRKSPARTTIITGVRGSGKTTILSDLDQLLTEAGVLTINVTAFDGMLNEILDILIEKGKNPRKASLRTLSASAFGFGLTFDLSSDVKGHHPGFRSLVTRALQSAAKEKVKLAFLIDEVHNKSEQMREFIIAYQHFVREGYDVQLVMAGLPNAVSDLLNDQVLTFLRRSNRIYLKNIPIKLVEFEFQDVFSEGKIKISQKVLEQLSEATDGYPYLFQLIGYYLWTSINGEVRQKDVERATEIAKIELFRNIHELVYHEISDMDREFLHVMEGFELPVETADIVKKLERSASYVSNYRRRLIDAGVIYAPSRGKLDFVLPYMKEFLREQE